MERGIRGLLGRSWAPLALCVALIVGEPSTRPAASEPSKPPEPARVVLKSGQVLRGRVVGSTLVEKVKFSRVDTDFGEILVPDTAVKEALPARQAADDTYLANEVRVVRIEGKVLRGPSKDGPFAAIEWKNDYAEGGAPQIAPGDTVKTEAGGSIDLMLHRDVWVRLGPETEVEISTSPAGGTLSLLRGTTLHDVTGQPRGQVYRIRTPSTVLGVRGTRFRASAAPAGDELAVAKGVVEVKDGPAVGARRAIRWDRPGGTTATDLDDAACHRIEVEHIRLPLDDMALVPSGDYAIGDSHEIDVRTGSEPAKGIDADEVRGPGPYARAGRIHLTAYLIDRGEVSVAGYQAFRACRGGAEPAMPGPLPLDGRLPVFGITARDAEHFAAWCGKRLPTCVEWEAAGRGPGGKWFPWGTNVGPEHRALSRPDWKEHSPLSGSWTPRERIPLIDEPTVDISEFGVRGLVSSVPEIVAPLDPLGDPFGWLSADIQQKVTQPGIHVVRGVSGSLISYKFVDQKGTAGFRCARSLAPPRR